mmetsp:Transcript_42789/g.78477  ORF Transcript_42789/g.78477 Transcript_42789/m.78477 type:complete len:100 (+) Transcript_42789:177-476(+)
MNSRTPPCVRYRWSRSDISNSIGFGAWTRVSSSSAEGGRMSLFPVSKSSRPTNDKGKHLNSREKRGPPKKLLKNILSLGLGPYSTQLLTSNMLKKQIGN